MSSVNFNPQDAFTKADLILFRDKKINEAERAYKQILSQLQRPENFNTRFCIEALNSIAYCVKQRVDFQQLEIESGKIKANGMKAIL